MIHPFEPPQLPGALRADVVRALRDGEGRQEAIEALERYLELGGERTSAVLSALAVLT